MPPSSIGIALPTTLSGNARVNSALAQLRSYAVISNLVYIELPKFWAMVRKTSAETFYVQIPLNKLRPRRYRVDAKG